MRVKSVPKYRYIRRNNTEGVKVPEKRSASMENTLIDKNEEYMDLEEYAKLLEVKKMKKTDANNVNQSVAIVDSFDDDLTEEDISSLSSTDQNTEVVNSSTRIHQQNVLQSQPSMLVSNAEAKLRESSLYKLMTDPNFMENIRKLQLVKKYTCQFCKRKFSNQAELNDHFDIRAGKEKIACCACEKTFTQKRYLRYHQRYHSERNKFVCAICTREYSRLDNLTRHENFHTNPAKFPCKLCERHFARRDLLKKHERCHENKNSFRCEACDKHFKGSVSLENHKKMFHKDIKSLIENII